LLKAKQGYTIRKMEKDKTDVVYIGKCWYETQEPKKFQNDIPAYTGPFPALLLYY
jgi:hypothetical protein